MCTFCIISGPAYKSFLCLNNSTASDDTQKSHRSRHCTHKSTGSSQKITSRSRSYDSQPKGWMEKGPKVIKICISIIFMHIYSFASVCLIVVFMMHYIISCHP